jgi:signal transduction histidine kinase
LTNATIQSVQRLVTELRPRLLDELGLPDAIRWQVREYQNRTGIRCRFLSRVTNRSCPGEISTAMFRILQETLTNVARHARATRVNISLKTVSRSLRLVICDNGRGVQTSELQKPTALGILGMRERTQLLGGRFDIYSTRGHGTQVSVTLPLRLPTPSA